MTSDEPEPGDLQPLYLVLADRIQAQMASAAPGARVASEPELVSGHGVSRLTARAALQELERRLVVRRVRGSGTYWAHRLDHPLGPTMSLNLAETVRGAGAHPTSTVDSVRTRRPTPAVRTLLDLDADDKVVAVTRTGRVDGLPAWHGTTHLPHELVEGIGDELVGAGGDDVSMVEVLRAGFGLAPVLGWVRAELAVVPTAVAATLEVAGRPLAWDVELGIHDQVLDRPLAVTRRWMRADVFHLRFEAGRIDGGRAGIDG